MNQAENVLLASLTTLRLGGPARSVLTLESEADVIESVTHIDARGTPILVLGGGSNVVISDRGFDGTVLRMATRGIDISPGVDDAVEVTVAAGEVWDDFVAQCVTEGWAGVECLAGIPGLVGAVPMQNVGAYGQDVSGSIVRVRTWDRGGRCIRVFDREACRFGYRRSVFRGHEAHIILSVTFALVKRDTGRSLHYAELSRALGAADVTRVPLAKIRETVIGLRRAKGMVIDEGDPDTTSAGSFFTNPIVDGAGLARVRARLAPGDGKTMPVFPDASGQTKLSAAWLIERAGFHKGYRIGSVSISTKHALALTNRGGGSTSELLSLARAIRDGVHGKFGVLLEPEPVFVGVEL